MTPHLRALFAAACCLLSAPAAVAGGAAPVETAGFAELRVGRTNILCYQEPCPRNGILRADGPVAPHQTLWSGDRLPALRGPSPALVHIRENYRDNCTLISGRFQDGILDVEAILGSC